MSNLRNLWSAFSLASICLGGCMAITAFANEPAPVAKITEPVRRVVTAHHEDGRSKFLFDDVSPVKMSPVEGVEANIIWASDAIPVSIDDKIDAAATTDVMKASGTGTVFTVVDFAPGVSGHMHRTPTIDFVAVLSGTLWLELEDGEVKLEAGDVVVQRGTLHAWRTGDEPCRIVVTGVPAVVSVVDGNDSAPEH